jgi:hypothetical protein
MIGLAAALPRNEDSIGGGDNRSESGVSVAKRLPRALRAFDAIGGGGDAAVRLPKHARGFDLTSSGGESNASAAVGGDNPPRPSDPNKPGIKLIPLNM